MDETDHAEGSDAGEANDEDAADSNGVAAPQAGGAATPDASSRAMSNSWFEIGSVAIGVIGSVASIISLFNLHLTTGETIIFLCLLVGALALIVVMWRKWLVDPGRGHVRAAGLLLGVTTLMVVSLKVMSGTDETPPESAITFTNPIDDEGIVSPVAVILDGSLPPGEELWILTRPPNEMYYTTSTRPAFRRQNGTWTPPRVAVGRGPEDEGNEFDLVAVLAPAGDNDIRDALAKTPGVRAEFTDIPDGTRQVATVRVRLTDWKPPN